MSGPKVIDIGDSSPAEFTRALMENSCGCVCCDLDVATQRLNGRLVHFIDVPCTRPPEPLRLVSDSG